MKNLEIGKEYLFSDDGETWFKAVLDIADAPFFKAEFPSGVKKTFALIKPLEERKLYTQSMKDEGKPIEVGMWFKDHADGDEFECLLPPDSEGDIVFMDNGGYCMFAVSAITPFPDPVKLIDGEAYEFEITLPNKIATEKGVFRGTNNRIYTAYNDYCIKSCTNIKHLTVKGE